MSEEIRLMLLEDHAATRQPLALILDQQPGIRVVAETASLDEARKALAQADLAVDVAMVDLNLDDGLGRTSSVSCTKRGRKPRCWS